MNDIYSILDEIGIKYQKFEHPPVYTVDEGKKYNRGSGRQSKNLFLRNKKGDKHFLVITDGSKRINLKELAESLGEPGLGFASEERLLKYLGLTPGSVSPFGLINDLEKQVNVIVDEELLDFPNQGFHPNVNTATLVINTDDFKKFLVWTNNYTRYLKL